MIRVQVLHILALNDQAISWVPVKVDRKQLSRYRGNMGPMGWGRGRRWDRRVWASMVKIASLRVPSIEAVIRHFRTDPIPFRRGI